MGKVLVTESYLTDIADAIRSKHGTEDTYLPSAMAAAITAIEPKFNGYKFVSGIFTGDGSGVVTIEHNLGYQPNGLLLIINTFGTWQSYNLVAAFLSRAGKNLGKDNSVTKTIMSSSGSSYSTGLINEFTNTETTFSFTDSSVMSGGEYYWIAY